MVNSVSNNMIPVNNQGKTIRAMDKVSQEQLYSPGLYAMRELMAPPPPYREKNSFIRFLGKLVLTAATVCATAVLARKIIPSVKGVDLCEPLSKEAKLGEIIKFKTAKFADGITDGLKDLFTKTPETTKKAQKANTK